jgi:hypothetical protein
MNLWNIKHLKECIVGWHGPNDSTEEANAGTGERWLKTPSDI